SKTSRSSSPLSIKERRIWSSHTLTPASVSRFSRGLTSVAVLMLPLRLRFCSLRNRASRLSDALGREAEVLVQRTRRRRSTGRPHPDRVAQVADPAVPAECGGRLHGHSGTAGRR